MTAVPSTMLALGTEAPPFELCDPEDSRHRLDDLAGDAPALVVMFLSNHCPYVRHIGRELGLVTSRLMRHGAAVIGIMSNDTEAYPDDAPERMIETARAFGWEFPYLFDATQTVAHDYRAACTPDFYVFDEQRRLAYRGQFDDARPSNDEPVTGRDLRAATDAVLAGAAPPSEQVASLGCNIKWKPGTEPEWFG